VTPAICDEVVMSATVLTNHFSPARDQRPALRAVGSSKAWCDVVDRAARVAATEVTVCLQGESGTGKEVIARFIHASSPRKHGPFVAINCAALPDQLVESELFGFERGAFTSAQQSKPGQIELARGGVLFLDEIAELSASAQAKLLRVLQEREFQRLGGTRMLGADIRVVAATNRDLRTAVSAGTFRADLYYRINVFDIRIPPLRERGDDVMLLAEILLDDIARTRGIGRFSVAEPAAHALRTYPWPGNVRELRNVLERATVMCSESTIDMDDLSLAPENAFGRPPSTDLNTVERSTIERVMHDVDGNVSKAARALGISRAQLYTRLRKHGREGRHNAVPCPVNAS
jgi:two-component system nitrogen regulation response regulator NtrX